MGMVRLTSSMSAGCGTQLGLQDHRKRLGRWRFATMIGRGRAAELHQRNINLRLRSSRQLCV